MYVTSYGKQSSHTTGGKAWEDRKWLWEGEVVVMSGAVQAFTSLTVRFTKKRHLFRFLGQILLTPGLTASERAPKMQHFNYISPSFIMEKNTKDRFVGCG